MSTTLPVAIGQFRAGPDKRSNVDRALAMIDRAAAAGAALVVLPELFTGLGFEAERAHEPYAEPVPGPTSAALAERARRHRLWVTGSYYERAGDRFHNTAPVIGPDGAIAALYRKTHLFDVPHRVDIPPGIVESRKVAPGDRLCAVDTPFGRIGITICADLRFPELYRALALDGCVAILCISAFVSPRIDHWEFLLRARATDNQLWLIASGQVGTDPASGIAFCGRSMTVDPWGVVTAQASDEDTLVRADLDLSLVATVRKRWDLAAQRRPALYAQHRPSAAQAAE
ncbi:MAG: nitrilase-related carbon-nitrogen hydrolase [Alphaproteobacteria bacterium]